jgi:outer membrane lipoprotein-sorting protein
MRIRQAFATGLLALTPALTGCLTHTHVVMKTRLPDVVRNDTLDQLLKQTTGRYDAIQSLTATIQVSVATGGSMQGVVKETIPYHGYIILSKPEQIRMIVELPLGVGQLLDMVSDGKSFKMEIPHYNCAIVGSDQSQPSQKGIYALRPAVILDSLLIHGMEPDQVVSMTQDSRVLENPRKKNDFIQEPDYDIEFLSQPQGHVARTLHVIHISRVDLLPYRHDIYNADGKIETQATYSNYQKFGDVNFPTKIVIQRPLDDLGLTITVTKANFNQQMPEDQFKLDIPTGDTITDMDDPANATVKDPCAVHAPQSPH